MRIKLEANTGPNDTLIRREKERYLDAILWALAVEAKNQRTM
jgi:hypothetical protein